MTDSKRTSYIKNGLSAQQVLRSRKLHGDNRLEKKKRKSFFRVFLSAFSDPIIRILIGAVCVNAVFTWKSFDVAETVGILAAVLIATTVSAISEYGSENAFEKLQESARGLCCRVRRDGQILSVPVEEVVVGDLIAVNAGEMIAADGILVEGALRVDQSALNGESAEASKHPSPQEADLWDPARKNQLFRGSTVCSGQGLMAVSLVGESTLYGQIAGEIQQESPASPMKLRLNKLASTVSILGYIAAVLVAAVYLLGTFWSDPTLLSDFGSIWKSVLDALTLAITILVVAVPEGLPMMITVVLSSNMKRMLKDKVLVRKPVGIETAGSLNILFTDKTGTLTQGKMSLEGLITAKGQFVNRNLLQKESFLWDRLTLSAYYDTAAEVSAEGKVLGSTATDRAILEGVLPMERYPRHRIKAKLGFDSERKYSAAWLEDGTVFIKGAPEKLLPKITKTYDSKGNILRFSDVAALKRQWKEQASKGARIVLAAEGRGGIPGKEIPGELILLGLIVLSDRLRPEAEEAVRQIRQAGVSVVMVTGDNPDTARSIAQSCGIIRNDPKAVVLTGDQLSAMSDIEVKKILPDLRVVARAVPSHKSRLVRLAQEQGLVAGMTGDGINDAAALKKADVGFAMGSASEIAKEAGDIVIMDDRFASIVKAVLYGRTLFKSIRKFVMFQFTMNICAVGISLLGPLFGIPQPVTVLQMLWVNIIMDTLGGLAFAGEAAMQSYMKEPPKAKDEPILNRSMIRQILVTGVGTLAVSLIFLKSEALRSFYSYYENPTRFLTAFFAMFIFAGVFNCFNMRSPRLKIFSAITKNRWFIPIMIFVSGVQMLFIYFGGPLLRTVPLTLPQLGLALLLAAAVVPVNLLAMVFSTLSGEKNVI